MAKTPDSIINYLTSSGKNALDLINKYGLGEYYDPQSGVAAIPYKLYNVKESGNPESIYSKVERFLKENKGWEGNTDTNDNNEEYIYINEKGVY